MATIRLEDVTRVFSGRPPTRGTRGIAGGQVDRAFADRAAAHALPETAEERPTGPVFALNHVTLTIPDGQTLAVVGPSGCGKSTLLRVVAGLDHDYTGRVFYNEQDMTGVPPKDRYIGMVFQNYALYPHFSGRENLAFTFWVRKAPDAETETRIRITSEIMGIGFEELLKRKPGQLSGGQQQRVAIGRAIVRDPHVFLFDEPLSNLDAKLRVQTRIQIKKLLNHFAITSIYVTHDQVEAITLGDQVAVMRAGRIEQMGPYQELRQQPVNTFVAGFLGSPPMNLLPGVIEEGGCRLADALVALPDAVKAHVHTGQAVTLGVRPEAIRLVTDAVLPAPEGGRLRGVVELVEPDFAHQTQLVHARTGALSFVVTGPLDPTLNIGDPVEVVLPTAGQLYWFDTHSELRIG